jgi:hypothetical protein
MGKTIQEEGRGASGGREGPRSRSGKVPPFPLLYRCIGHRLVVPTFVEFPLLVVLVQRFEERHQRVAVIEWDERYSSQGIGAIKKGTRPGLIGDSNVESDDIL